MWSTRSLSAIGSTSTSAAGLMTPFQSLSFSRGGGISTRGRFCAGTVRPWVARRQQAWLPSVPVWRFSLLCLFPREEHLFPKQKAVGRGLILRASTRPSRSPYCSGATHECVYAAPSFLNVASTYRKHASVTSPLDLPLVSV
jgi:hypothetical protein